MAGAITDKEAALLKVYRLNWVRDTDGALGVDGVRVHAEPCHYQPGHPIDGALVVCSSRESKK